MMAGLFLLLSLAIFFLFMNKKKWGIAILFSVLILSMLMLWYHATDTLKINW
jgi:hypothetical protein